MDNADLIEERMGGRLKRFVTHNGAVNIFLITKDGKTVYESTSSYLTILQMDELQNIEMAADEEEYQNIINNQVRCAYGRCNG